VGTGRPARSVENGCDESRKTSFEVIPPQGDEALGSIDSGADHASLPHYFEVVAQGALGAGDLKIAAAFFS
jgi:hypothetical protein